METLLLFLVYSNFTPKFNTAPIMNHANNVQILYDRIGNMEQIGDSCQVREGSDDSYSYYDPSIQNQLFGGEYKYRTIDWAFSRTKTVTPEQQQQLFRTILAQTGKKCSDFVFASTFHDENSGNWIYNIVDLTDFTYNVYLNTKRMATFDTYYNSEKLYFWNYFSKDGQHVVNSIVSVEPDASDITPALRKKIEPVVGVYVDGVKILNAHEKYTLDYDEMREKVEEYLKNQQ